MNAWRVLVLIAGLLIVFAIFYITWLQNIGAIPRG